MLDKKINKMEESPKLVWVEGTSKIQCNIKHVEKSILNIGKHFTSAISLMPGITSVELIE